MRPTHFATPLENKAVRCDTCQWRCHVAPGELGRCLVRRNDDGALMVLADGMISAAVISPVEDHGFSHFFPDTRVFAVGSWGTPFPTEQASSQYANIPEDPKKQRTLEAERIAAFAQDKLCRGVIWSFSDPTMVLEFLSDGVRYGRAGSRYVGIVTNGYWTLDALDLVGHYLDGINLRMYGFSDASYKQLTGVEHWHQISEAATRAVDHWGCHLEVTYLLHKGVNDSEAELKSFAAWLTEINPLIPVHLVPGEGQPDVSGQARHILTQAGVKFIYGPDGKDTTRCPGCGFPVIERSGDSPKLVGVEEGHCDNCGADLYLRVSIHKKRPQG